MLYPSIQLPTTYPERFYKSDTNQSFDYFLTSFFYRKNNSASNHRPFSHNQSSKLSCFPHFWTNPTIDSQIPRPCCPALSYSIAPPHPLPTSLANHTIFD